MSLVYIFTFSKVETEQVARLMGATAAVKPGARVGPVRVGANDFVLFASDMGPKIARSLANSVLNNTNPAHVATVANPRPDAVLIVGLCGGLTANLQQNTHCHLQGMPVHRRQRHRLPVFTIAHGAYFAPGEFDRHPM